METRIAAASFLDYCRLRSLRPRTLEFYQWGLNHLALHCRHLPSHHRELVAPLANPNLGLESRYDLERVLRRFFGWIEKEYHLPNPMDSVESIPRKRTLPRVLSSPETEAVWKGCCTERDRAMVALVLDTGLRLGEIAAMEKRHLIDGMIRVWGKVGQRQVPITPQVREMLLQVGDTDKFWVGRRRRHMGIHGVQQAYQRIFLRAGLSGPKLHGPHCLRHTFGTQYIASGGNVRVLQSIMGHLRLETTMAYVNLAGETVIRDHAQHSPFRRLLM